MSALRRLVKRVRPTIRQDVRDLVRSMARRSVSRSALNRLYRSLSFAGKERFHAAFSDLFRGVDQDADVGVWQVSFAGKRILLPFGGRETWLEWDAATAILGHDADVKRTYEMLLRSSRRPGVFFDVGANFGLHSLLFLAHGVRTVSFEPNPACHGYLRAVAALNGAEPDIRAVALGEASGTARLTFPETETWLGTTVASARQVLARRGKLIDIQVPRVTLDEFCADDASRPDLLKIDTEGNELAVLQGGLQTLGNARPVVIFESWPGAERHDLFILLDNVGYRICELPLGGLAGATSLDKNGFANHPSTNFAALPHDARR